MNHRAVVTVATGAYVRGAQRLNDILAAQGEDFVCWLNRLPNDCPSHRYVPYAFKAYALKHAEKRGYTSLLWADACIRPVSSLEPIWERIEKDGYWMSNNGFTNDQWTADSAYPDLFTEATFPRLPNRTETEHWDEARAINHGITHVVATTFGIDLRHSKGRAFLKEYFRLASETKAFCGPWINANAEMATRINAPRVMPCGPLSTRGHRHDQTAASVIAWRLGFKLTSPPDLFAYPNADGSFPKEAILIADGKY